MARCPLHMDVRLFIKKVADNRLDEAFKTLALIIPFPGILGRICDHPCEAVCRRIEAGGTINISALEKTIVLRSRTTKPPTVLPRKEKKAAVIGSGLSGLTCALDLLKKGYAVTILEAAEVLGGDLWEIPRAVLSREVILQETGMIEQLGASVSLREPMETVGWLEGKIPLFDAVYIGLDSKAVRGLLPGITRLPPDPLTLMTNRTGLFLGGTDVSSPVNLAAQGRKAAVSIDRYVQKVSLTAGREKEGPYETKLYTSLNGVKHTAPVPENNAFSGYTDTQAQQEAARCLQCQCMECVKACLYLERFKSYPKTYLRQIGSSDTIVLGSHSQGNRLINSCSLCGLCGEICPNKVSMVPVCLEGREALVQKGRMPPSAHDLALQDLASANSEKAAVARHEPGRNESSLVLFPGCQLGAIDPEHVSRLYRLLRTRYEKGVGLMLRCCGVPAKWAGRDDLFQESLASLKHEWTRLACPTMIIACPTCYQTLEEHLPQARLVGLWDVLNDLGISPGRAPKMTSGPLAVHDPCSTRHRPEIRRSARRFLTALGYDLEELTLSGNLTECCGYGGLMSSANPPLAQDVAKRRATLTKIDFVTYCAMCRNALAATGKRVYYMLDLILENPEIDPAERRPVGYSERHENRYRLKDRLMRNLWGEKERAVEESEKILLIMSEDVATRLEERRILHEDIRTIIDRAERSGEKLHNTRLGRWVAQSRPRHITYWVEYSPEGNGFRVHNAYSHRMEIGKGATT